jgi:hypothetical protein
MLKKELFISLLIAVFSLGLFGVAIADHGGHDNFKQMTGVEIEQENDAATENDAINDRQSETDEAEPLVCETDLSPRPEQFANAECRDLYRDIYRG